MLRGKIFHFGFIPYTSKTFCNARVAFWHILALSSTMYVCMCVHEYTHRLAYVMQGDNDSFEDGFHEILLKVPRMTEASSCRVVFISILDD